MVTIKEIAREANVSPTTVSLILNNKSKERKISAQTEQRVLQIAKRMGYLPNLQAVSLKKATGQFSYRIIIFWVADSRAQTMLRFFRSIEATIEEEKLPFEVLLQPYRAGSLQLALKNELILSCHGTVCSRYGGHKRERTCEYPGRSVRNAPKGVTTTVRLC